jgi:hypothetical protein
MCFGCSGVQSGDVQVSSVRGLHGGAVGDVHHQGIPRNDFVQACCIDKEKVVSATGVHY